MVIYNMVTVVGTWAWWVVAWCKPADVGISKLFYGFCHDMACF